MKCKYPITHVDKGRAYGCGQCVTCRINKRRQWTNRIVLEASLYEDNTFMTLTYSDENLPEDLSVSKYELQNFIKRLRKKHGKLRYFAVGEYGSQTNRPHYHVIGFGVPNCLHGRTRGKNCCPVCLSIAEVWGLGNIYLGQVSQDSAGYCAGYVVKGWTRDIPLLDRSPEFTLKSLKPGIGEGFAWEMASELLRVGRTSVPRTVRHNGRLWPLGRYMLEKVSEYSGDLPIDKAFEETEVLDLSNDIYSDPTIRPSQKAWRLREAVIAKNIDRINLMETKWKRAQRRRPL